MKRIDLVHRGHVAAAGFIIDVPTIGLHAARARVLDSIDPHDRLLRLADGRWLALCDRAIEVDCAQAPGLVLVRQGEALASLPDADSDPGIAEFRLGGITAHTPAGLDVVDRTSWFDLGTVVALDPIEAAVDAPAVVADPPAPDLRAKAGVGKPPARTAQVLDELRGAAGQRRRQRGATGGAVGVPLPLQAIRSAIARGVMRSPAAGYVSRKHLRYLEELTRRFNSGDMDEALRRAIPLGGSHRGALSLKVPQRRADLRISAGHGAATTVPVGLTMHQHLQALYREAAARLEGAGRIDEATYVYAELLNDVQGCVALLERHGRFETAARIAEQREIDAAVTVRLWWLAKDRKRAIAVARRHHAFAAAITRLEQSDPAAADSLRIEWIADLEQAGDLLGAVEVAWPKPSLRPLLINIIARGEDIGGPTGGAIKGYGLALKATDERIASATELLNAERDSGERTGFLSTFASVAAASPSADRRLATIFIRSNPLSPTRHDATTDWWWMIRKRADTALVADLPAGAQHQPPPPPILRLPDLPVGHLITVTDAAALPSGDVLVALGALGCRLVRRTGHTVAEWHMPTSHIVMADHGGRALLLDQRTDGEVDIRRLDLTTRRLDVYGTMEVASFSDSFDGAHWFVIDRGGAAIVDMTAGSPTIRWRPIDSNTDCHSLLRTANEVTALVTTPRHSIGGRGLELRTWNPTMTRLTGRSAVRFPPDTSEYQLVPNGFLVQRGEHLQIHFSDGAQRVDLGPGETAWSVGDLLVRTTADAERRSIRLQRLVDRADVLQHDLDPGEPSLSFRSHGTLVTAWDRSGRVHALDLNRRVVLSSVRVLL